MFTVQNVLLDENDFGLAEHGREECNVHETVVNELDGRSDYVETAFVSIGIDSPNHIFLKKKVVREPA